MSCIFTGKMIKLGSASIYDKPYDQPPGKIDFPMKIAVNMPAV